MFVLQRMFMCLFLSKKYFIRYSMTAVGPPWRASLSAVNVGSYVAGFKLSYQNLLPSCTASLTTAWLNPDLFHKLQTISDQHYTEPTITNIWSINPFPSPPMPTATDSYREVWQPLVYRRSQYLDRYISAKGFSAGRLGTPSSVLTVPHLTVYQRSSVPNSCYQIRHHNDKIR